MQPRGVSMVTGPPLLRAEGGGDAAAGESEVEAAAGAVRGREADVSPRELGLRLRELWGGG